MRVFVTGGSGVVGRDLIARLVADGREVVALARSDAASAELEGLGAARSVRGDLFDREALAEGMAGCEVVYHVAGVNAMCVADPRPMFRTNIEGSRRVVRAAADAGVRRLVHTSSAAAIGEARGTVGSEESLHRGTYLSRYEQSKHRAEQAVWKAAAGTELEVVAVLPSSVQGPGRGGGTAKILLDFVNGTLPAVIDSRLSIVDIRDCAAGHVLAELHGKAGERYVLNGATMTVREGLGVLSEVTGVDTRVRSLPGPVASGAAAAAAAVARVRRREPRFCPEMVRTLRHGHAYDGSKAARELGLEYTPVAETLERTIRWFAEQRMITRDLPGLGIRAADG
ncbi:NAD-dependent epimerase/dehydratase family protein [Egibacter rhizosphaerae]|uniref:NAD-dependent epimerase/dehydratase family protein n=1 Tax=Egibacter rhizosphaerae TaxID=1670831 RepID=A0A411YHS8_9ACTN|nr:NAD-dependent epimerase/dehydratase family protein [Egibacter rhizosphaerae]QBI20666.1 NAD-dependent epimerase/dehydratase family protein [Egibacter rhizosphaerae]